MTTLLLYTMVTSYKSCVLLQNKTQHEIKLQCYKINTYAYKLKYNKIEIVLVHITPYPGGGAKLI